MNVYARIRTIENQQEFKRLFNTLLAAEYKTDFQPTKDLNDFGIDGYRKSTKTVYAVYCPVYPERKERKKYIDKINSDLKKLKQAVKNKEVSLSIKEWLFVTPDDMEVKIIDHIYQEAKKEGWKSGVVTATMLVPMFLGHEKIHRDFPEITAGLQLDKIPSVVCYFGNNKGFRMLEVFNDGTEDLKDLEVYYSQDGVIWNRHNDHFHYEADNPIQGKNHTCNTLKKGERQFLEGVYNQGGFSYRIVGVGVESGKTMIKEDTAKKLPPP